MEVGLAVLQEIGNLKSRIILIVLKRNNTKDDFDKKRKSYKSMGS